MSLMRVIDLILISFLFSVLVPGWGGEKVIYGEDNRYNLYDYHNQVYIDMAQATAVMVEKWDLWQAEGEFFQLAYSPLRHQRGFCSDVSYLDQNSIGICSGFLIAPDLLVTAGHCMDKSNSCDLNRWVFGYNQKALEQSDLIPKSNAYSCTIVDQVLDQETGRDYAVVRLSRPVLGVSPLKVRTSGEVASGTPLTVIGHPSGLPTKISDGGSVRSSEQTIYFTANIDTFGGNSGSPVISRNSGKVEGILVRGEEDYDYDRMRGCYFNKQCENDECSGESATKMSVIKNLSQYLN
jgi:V8-like Glu-specific endopeptidase